MVNPFYLKFNTARLQSASSIHHDKPLDTIACLLFSPNIWLFLTDLFKRATPLLHVSRNGTLLVDWEFEIGALFWRCLICFIVRLTWPGGQSVRCAHVAQLDPVCRVVRVGLRARGRPAVHRRPDRVAVAGLYRRAAPGVPGHHRPAAEWVNRLSISINQARDASLPERLFFCSLGRFLFFFFTRCFTAFISHTRWPLSAGRVSPFQKLTLAGSFWMLHEPGH